MLFLFLACSVSSEPTPAVSATAFVIVEPTPAEVTTSPTPVTATTVPTPSASIYSACVLLKPDSTPVTPFIVAYAPAYSDVEPEMLTFTRTTEVEDLWCADTGSYPESPRGMAIVVYAPVATMVTEARVYTIDGDYATASIIEGSNAERAFYELRIPGVQELANLE